MKRAIDNIRYGWPIVLAALVFCLITGQCRGQNEKSPFKGAKKVIVSVPYNADSLFNSFVRILLRDGWPVEADKTIKQINSSGKSIGKGTFMRPLIFIEPSGTGSIAYVSGQWGLDASGQIMMKAISGVNTTSMNEIIFSKRPSSKTDLAFEKLISLSKDVSGGLLTYKE